MIKVVTTREGFEALGSAWTELYDRCERATPYQSFSLCKTCWEIWQPNLAQLYIICHHKKQEWPADAIFPCYLQKGILYWIDFHCDFCEPIEDVPRNERYEMYLEVVDYIKKDTQIRKVDFSRIKYDSPLLEYFKAFWSDVEIKAITGYPVIRLSGALGDSWISSIETLTKPKQRKIKDIEKKASNMLLQFYENGKDLYPGRDIKSLAAYMTRQGIRSDEYLTDKFLEFFHELYRSNDLKVAIGYENDEPVACFFLLFNRHGNEWIEWVLLYREKKYNLYLMLAWLNRLGGESSETVSFNLANGLYGYKLLNFHPQIHLVYHLLGYKSRKDYYKEILVGLCKGMMHHFFKRN